MRVGTEWNGFRVMPDQFIDAGDTVVVVGRYTGTFKATGQQISAPFVHVWKFRNGKAVAYTNYTDTAQFDRVMGLSRCSIPLHRSQLIEIDIAARQHDRHAT